tara:strand:- start:1516 stop:1698 length:183 start_codon:yes stop_codon:yes gene_type:complete
MIHFIISIDTYIPFLNITRDTIITIDTVITNISAPGYKNLPAVTKKVYAIEINQIAVKEC